VLTLDGSHGEGGGQVLRTALSLAVALGRPVRLVRIRARRRKPGLQPQHLAVVRALAMISDGEVSGDALGATELTFVPRGLRAGAYRFDVGTAGSVSLLFQALLPPLTLARAPSRLALVGGTHVPMAPVAHYLIEVFLPALGEAGVEADLTLRRWGWYPAGGGEIEATVAPAQGRGFRLVPPARDAPLHGLSAVSRLPRSIAERQRDRALARLGAASVAADIAVEEVAGARGPGTLLFLATRGRAGFFALGRRGVPAERIADEAVEALLAHRTSGAAVDEHLADQLVPVLALARAGSEYTCPRITLHLRTVAWVVEQLAPVRVVLEEGTPARVRIGPG
jgi:RNA 3'-terminal phosphate cyclase (ATP)